MLRRVDEDLRPVLGLRHDREDVGLLLGDHLLVVGVEVVCGDVEALPPLFQDVLP